MIKMYRIFQTWLYIMSHKSIKRSLTRCLMIFIGNCGFVLLISVAHKILGACITLKGH